MALGIVLAFFGIAGSSAVSALLSQHPAWAGWVTNVSLVVGIMCVVAGLWLIGRDIWKRLKGSETHIPAERVMWFYEVLRYLSHESRWASGQPKNHDEWLNALKSEFLAKVSLEALHGYGRRYEPFKEQGPRRIEQDFWRRADLWGLDKIMADNSTKHFLKSGNGEAYTEIFFDRREVRRVWPKRSIVAVRQHRSPAEDWGFVAHWAEEDAKNDAQMRRLKDRLGQRLEGSSA